MKQIILITITVFFVCFTKTVKAQVDAPVTSSSKSFQVNFIQDSLDFSSLIEMNTAERLAYLPETEKQVVLDKEDGRYYVYTNSQWLNVIPNALQICQIQIAEMRKEIALLQQEVQELKSEEKE